MKQSKDSVVKSYVIGNKRKKKDAYEEVVAANEQGKGTELLPPYDPTELYTLYEHTSLLKPNIEAYSSNVDLFGYDILSVVPLGTDSDESTVRDVMFENAILTGVGVIPDKPEDYTPEEVAATTALILRLSSIDKIKAESFFRNCSDKYSFSRLRAETRHDMEVTGNGYWEILRDQASNVKKFVRVLPNYIKCRPLTKELCPHASHKRLSRMTVTEFTEMRRARTYKVDVEGSLRYLKEFGCKAVISSLTGAMFADMETFLKWRDMQGDATDEPGNEIKHFTNYTNLSEPYGIPRWIGALIDVMASKAIGDFNVSFFQNGFMSPLAVLVSGGTLSPESVRSIETFISEGKGENAHKVMVLEAVQGATSDLSPTVTFKDLRSAIDSEASFLEYDKRNSDKVGTQFRISDIVRGNTTTTANKATADAAILQAEAQVFTPLRNEFDWVITEQMLPALGLTNVKFVSRGYSSNDTAVVGPLILDAVTKNVLRPNEARELMEPIFKRAFAMVKEPWGDYPPQILGLFGNVLPTQPAPVAPPVSNTEPSTVLTNLDNEISALLIAGNSIAQRYQGEEAAAAILADLGLE